MFSVYVFLFKDSV